MSVSVACRIAGCGKSFKSAAGSYSRACKNQYSQQSKVLADRSSDSFTLSVENRQFVVLEILNAEGVLQPDFDDRLLRPKDCVQQADQGPAILRRTEGFLEGKIIGRSDSWPGLPEAIKAGISAMVRAADGAK